MVTWFTRINQNPLKLHWKNFQSMLTFEMTLGWVNYYIYFFLVNNPFNLDSKMFTLMQCSVLWAHKPGVRSMPALSLHPWSESSVRVIWLVKSSPPFMHSRCRWWRRSVMSYSYPSKIGVSRMLRVPLELCPCPREFLKLSRACPPISTEGM